ncbi:MAG: hypothetical protein K2I22_04820 [Lachnospiraceae bacterium]|nr:hypothetical protein [Lachnospiraceae bacterium]
MMNKFKKFLNHPLCKSMLLGISTLIIGGICSAMGSWNPKEDHYFYAKVVFLGIISLAYLASLAFYSTYEINTNKTSILYEKQNKTFEQVMTGLMNVCRKSSSGSNKVIKSIIERSSADLELWSFDEACFWVCKNIYDTLCEIGYGKEFEVIYDRLDESEKPEMSVYTNAYANKDMKRPTVYNVKRDKSSHKYHDIELFRKNESETEVIMGSEEIDKVFEHENANKRRKNKNKYNQYIAIPVFCNDDKMVGLFEIVCLNKTYLAEKEEEVRELASRYFVPYTYFTLLLNKLEKALVAQPR